ncbi:MAG: Flp pilus assembly protein CpaB [Kiritimatiellaeota bacterium]|nr:Flp pilus assembly protein CpaB [Kiritimatiellota bacterium]
MKQKVVLIVSVVVGLLAAFLTRSYLNAKDREVQQMKADIAKRSERIPVIVVNKDLPSGTVLSSSDLGVSDEPRTQVQGRAIEEKGASMLFGRKLAQALKAGSVVFWADIEGGGPDARGLSGDIKRQMRGVSVDVSGAASVSGMVQPNDHVDVLGTFTFPSKAAPGEMELVTLTMIQDVLVLATGKETAKSRLFASSFAGSAYSTVTLEVTPREAEMLEFTKHIKGRVSLALRNPEDIYTETTLPRVNFEKIEAEIEALNKYRQETIHRKRMVN